MCGLFTVAQPTPNTFEIISGANHYVSPGEGSEDFSRDTKKLTRFHYRPTPVRLCDVLMVSSQFLRSTLYTLLATTDPPSLPPENYVPPPPQAINDDWILNYSINCKFYAHFIDNMLENKKKNKLIRISCDWLP